MPTEPATSNLVAREEKWISSATLFEAPENGDSPAMRPQTPIRTPLIPAMSLNTPGGRSSHSVNSTSPHGSPSGLTPLKFIRRAEVDTPAIPITPSKAGPRARIVTPHTPVLSRAGSPSSANLIPPIQLVTPVRGPYWRP